MNALGEFQDAERLAVKAIVLSNNVFVIQPTGSFGINNQLFTFRRSSHVKWRPLGTMKSEGMKVSVS